MTTPSVNYCQTMNCARCAREIRVPLRAGGGGVQVSAWPTVSLTLSTHSMCECGHGRPADEGQTFHYCGALCAAADASKWCAAAEAQTYRAQVILDAADTPPKIAKPEEAEIDVLATTRAAEVAATSGRWEAEADRLVVRDPEGAILEVLAARIQKPADAEFLAAAANLTRGILWAAPLPPVLEEPVWQAAAPPGTEHPLDALEALVAWTNGTGTSEALADAKRVLVAAGRCA